MRTPYHTRETKRSFAGQASLIAILFLMVLSLTGLCYYIFTKQEEAKETLSRLTQDQEKNISSLKETLVDLNLQIKNEKASQAEQKDKLINLQNESAAMKTSLAEFNSLKYDISAIKADIQKRENTFQSSLDKVRSGLDNLSELLNKVKEGLPPAGVPFVDVTLYPEPVKADNTKQKSAKK